MKFLILFVLCYTNYVLGSAIYQEQTQLSDHDQVIEYLVDYGYLESKTYRPHQLRRAIRYLQKENNLTVNGRITPNVVDFVKNENDKKMVIDYLKKFNYLLGDVNPNTINNAVTKLQLNTGVLNANGVIDGPTINFVKTHPYAYSDGLFANK